MLNLTKSSQCSDSFLARSSTWVEGMLTWARVATAGGTGYPVVWNWGDTGAVVGLSIVSVCVEELGAVCMCYQSCVCVLFV